MNLISQIRKNPKQFLIDNFLYIGLFVFALGIFFVNVKINLFRYNNFDYGKFDLGNMTQMVWYTAYKGKFLYLTDYFGTNLPRWAMSHVDPILALFVPFFYIWPHPLLLVFSQLILVIFSSLLVYKIAELELKSKVAAFLAGMTFLFYPAVGFLSAWTGFHGVTAAIPFFLAAFYVFEKMYKEQNFDRSRMRLFWLLLVVNMMGKEQIPLYVALFGVYVFLFRGMKKLGTKLFAVGVFWFVMAFFVIIPKYADVRIQGFEDFAQSLQIESEITNDVARPNFFLGRYAEFGESYSEVIKNIILRPDMVVRVFFGGDNTENLVNTFEPLGYFPLLNPALFMIAIPDMMINYLTTQGGIGTAEIINHRISMIIPVLFIAAIYAISYWSKEISRISKIRRKPIIIVLTGFMLFMSVQTSFSYQNPVYLWLTQAIQKRLPQLASVAFAQSEAKFVDEEYLGDIEIGDRFSLSALENKDRACALRVVEMIPDEASVSGPDYLGAHLAQRETYAIFPSLYNSADYVVVDVFAQKVLRILGVDNTLVNDVVGQMIKSDEYRLDLACGNLFVFKKVGPHGKPALLPLQEKFEYDEDVDLEIFLSLTLVDYILPETVTRGQNASAEFVYIKRDNDSLDGYFSFLSFINEDTGELYQVANIPSFGLKKLQSWTEDRYYIEDIEIALPKRLDEGTYRVFIGINNNVRTRSIYIGDVLVQ